MTQKAKHTPGPWKINQHKKSQIIFALPNDDNNWGNAELCGMNLEANAALIAAAPELLEALKKLVLRCEHDRKCSWKEYGPASDKPCNCGMHQADEAISKAEGVIGGNSWL